MEIASIIASLAVAIFGIAIVLTSRPRTAEDIVFGILFVAVGYGIGCLTVGAGKTNDAFALTIFVAVSTGITYISLRRPRHREETPPSQFESN